MTKTASQNNSVIIAHTDDSNIEDDKRIVYIPAADYPQGAKRNISCTGWGFPHYNGTDRGLNYTFFKLVLMSKKAFLSLLIVL